MNKIRICYLYSDLLNPAGDFGNLKALTRHLEQNKINSEIKNHKSGEKINAKDSDIFYLGGAQDFDREAVLDDMNKTGNAEEIKSAIESGKTFLAIGGGFELLGKYFETLDKKQVKCLDILDFYTIDSTNREAKNFLFEVSDAGKVAGFENHSGKTFLSPNIRPLGQVLVGEGNNGEDKTEGARFKNTFCTYAGGPVLVKNPAFCNLILSAATDKNIKTINIYENAAHNYLVERLESTKRTSSNF